MRFLKLTYLSVLIIIYISCSESGKKPLIPDSDKNLQRIPAVSVYDYSRYGLPLLKNIYNSKSQVASIKLGERFFYLDSIKTDTIKDNEYCKVELSDGITGWAKEKYIIKNAFPGVVLEPTPIFERPDILTKSVKKEYTLIDFVVIAEEKDDWYKVIGRNHMNTGWLPKQQVILDETDIACVVLARRELLNKEGDWVFEKFEDFIKTSPFRSEKVFEVLRSYRQEHQKEILDEYLED